MRVALEIQITIDQAGRGFRFYALQKGREMGLNGTISTHGGGFTITMHIEGKEDDVKKYIALISKGSPHCKVTNVNILPAEVHNYSRFDIINLEPRPIRTISSEDKPRRFALKIGIFGL